MGGGEESHDQERSHGRLEPDMPGYDESDCGESESYENLHDYDPCTPSVKHVDKRTPQRLYHGREAEKRSVECKLGVGNAHPFEQDGRHRHQEHIGEAFGNVERRNPQPATGYVVVFHNGRDL